jgi:hypothetical protein
MIFQRFSGNKKKTDKTTITIAKPLSKTVWGLFDLFFLKSSGGRKSGFIV